MMKYLNEYELLQKIIQKLSDKADGFDEFWYDEKDNIRKEISYWSNGNKYRKHHFNDEQGLHNEDGFASQKWDINGNIEYQKYYINNIEVSESEWKEEVAKLKNNE